jgi:methionyl-tRNA formyltransferase
MNIVLWIGNEPNQKAFANKLQREFSISGIVAETKANKPKRTILVFIEKVIEKLFLSSIGKAWWNMLSTYSNQYPNYPKVLTIDVENINSDEAFHFTQNLQPDLILVSGTRLIKEKMLSIAPPIGILNLHTGISPYVKANNTFHLIGNTIMWIDKGIDSGNILTTEFTEINGSENLNELHFKVMEHAHDLYIQAVHFLAEGKRQSIPQSSISDGVTFYNKQWNLKQKINVTRNFPSLKKQIADVKLKQKTVKTVKL